MTREQFNAQRERAMWKKLSSELKWTEELLDKYADNVDWEEISSNENVVWTESLIQKFAGKLYWEELSRNDASALLCPEIIRPFVLYWRWDKKTDHTAWTPRFIEEMKDYLDWDSLFRASSYKEQEYLLKEYFYYISRLNLERNIWGRNSFDKFIEANWKERASEILCQANIN